MLDDLLARHRAGDPRAAMALAEHYLYLVDEALARQQWKLLPHHDAEELRSQLHLDLVLAVNRLQRNAATVHQLERYLAASMKHSYAHYMGEVAEDIIGEDGMLTRVERVQETSPGELVDVLDSAPDHNQPFDNLIVEEAERQSLLLVLAVGRKMMMVAETRFERAVAVGFFLGIEPEDMAKMLQGPSITAIESTARRLSAA